MGLGLGFIADMETDISAHGDLVVGVKFTQIAEYYLRRGSKCCLK